MALGGVKAPTDSPMMCLAESGTAQLAGTNALKNPFTLTGGGCILFEVTQRERWRQPRKC